VSLPDFRYLTEKKVSLETKKKLQKPRMYKVLLHNDDYTPMEFVVMVLQKVFHKTKVEATHLMWAVHKKGVAVAGTYTREIAETKVILVQDLAQTNEHPLRCSMERE